MSISKARRTHAALFGFTAIEVLLTVGTIALSSGLAVPMYRQYLVRNDLEIARQNVSQGLERAKFLSQVAMNDSQWGYSTDAVPGRGVLFMGNSYATRNSAFDELYTIPTTISVTGITEVTFGKITGTPSEEGTVTLTALNGEQRTINVNIGSDGTVTIPEDWLQICVDPYGANPLSLQVPDSLWIYYSNQGSHVGECGAGGPVCGNGYLEVGEGCDDSGESATCDSNCTTATCGDGTLNTTAGEQCDDSNTTGGDGCDANCITETCGNSVIQSGETCDDGGESALCDSNCTVATCGDGTLNTTAGETCDDGGESSTCDTDCTAVSCGDGSLNTTAGEECDDGNTTNGDGCDSSCENEPACGDSTVDAGEQCDDGNTTNGDGCDSSCNNEVCLNSIVQSGEDCDDGAESATCDTDCTTRVCGDSTTNTTAGEQCDDGNTTNNDGCSSTCQNEVCGDSIVQTSETCDDGNTTSGDGCSSSCQTEGSGGGVTFTVSDNGVVPDQNYDCEVKVLGAALDNGWYNLPVTLQVKEDGSWVDSFGDWSLPVDSNVNTGQTYDATCSASNIAAGVAIHIRARSWDKKYSWYSGTSNSHWEELYEVDTEDNDNYVEVLTDGDAIPSYSPLNNQSTIETFVADYIDLDANEMSMESNEVIYLFELGTTNLSSSAADFQDLVLLVTLSVSS